MSEICRHCHSFGVFGRKCWFFWEGKKSCSQFKSSAGEEPKFCSIELVAD